MGTRLAIYLGESSKYKNIFPSLTQHPLATPLQMRIRRDLAIQNSSPLIVLHYGIVSLFWTKETHSTPKMAESTKVRKPKAQQE